MLVVIAEQVRDTGLWATTCGLQLVSMQATSFALEFPENTSNFLSVQRSLNVTVLAKPTPLNAHHPTVHSSEERNLV